MDELEHRRRQNIEQVCHHRALTERLDDMDIQELFETSALVCSYGSQEAMLKLIEAISTSGYAEGNLGTLEMARVFKHITTDAALWAQMQVLMNWAALEAVDKDMWDIVLALRIWVLDELCRNYPAWVKNVKDGHISIEMSASRLMR